MFLIPAPVEPLATHGHRAGWHLHRIDGGARGLRCMVSGGAWFLPVDHVANGDIGVDRNGHDQW